MARKPEEVILAGQMSLSRDVVSRICESVPEDIPEVHKVFGVAASVIQKMAGGGMILTPETVARISAIHGGPIEEIDLPGLVEQAHSQEDGKEVYRLRLDPAWADPIRESAAMMGIPPEQVISDAIEYWADQGVMFGEHHNIQYVRMDEADKTELENSLGGRKFSNGTELAAAVKSFLNEGVDLFTEAGR